MSDPNSPTTNNADADDAPMFEEDDDADDDDMDLSRPMRPSKYFGKEEKTNDENDIDVDASIARQEALYDEQARQERAAIRETIEPQEEKQPTLDPDQPINIEELPAFANAENKLLNAQVRTKEKLLRSTIDAVASHGERITIMREHLKNVEQEHVHTQALVTAKEREMASERHMRLLTEREEGRVRADLAKADKIMAEIQDKLNSLQNNKFQASERMEQFKMQMNWNQEELLQWSLAAKQKDEDRDALKKYGEEDRKTLKKLTLRSEVLARQVQEYKESLDREITETQAVQIELDKTAEEYRRQHQEKQDLIRQWDEASKAMIKRDQDIRKVGEQIAQGKADIRAREALVFEQKGFLATEQANNKQLNVNIAAMDRLAEKKRAELNAAKKDLIEFEDEVSTQRSELEKAESELKLARTTNANLTQLRDERVTRLEDFKKQVEQTRQTLTKEYSNTDNLTDRANQVDELYKQHLAKVASQTKELSVLKESMFKHSHELFNKRKQEADLIAEISGAQGTSRNLQQRIHELDQRSLKQQEMLYNIEFQVQQLERKVSFASGKRSLEETVALNQQIEQLQATLATQTATHTMIATQVKRLHDDLRAARRKYQSVCDEREVVKEKIAGIELENDSATLEVKESTKKKEEMIVSHDVLKLELQRLRDTLTERDDAILSLEQRARQLTLAMREREKEIDLHQEIQRAEQKSAEENRHKIAMELKERQIKVEKLKKKYETIAGKLAANNEANGVGEEQSQAYYIIAAAQEREELQREGDQLNATIRQCEREIRMLANTHDLLNQHNLAYRASLQPSDPTGSEAQKKQQLTAQQRALHEKLYKQRSYYRELKVEFEEKRNVLLQLVNDIGAVQAEVSRQEEARRENERVLRDQAAKLARAQRYVETEKRSFTRTVTDPNARSVAELKIAVSTQKRKNRALLDLVQSFAQQNTGIGDELGDLLVSLGLREEDRPSSSSSTSSRFSSQSRPDSASSTRSSRPSSSSSQRSSHSRSSRSGSTLPTLSPRNHTPTTSTITAVTIKGTGLAGSSRPTSTTRKQQAQVAQF